MLLDTSNLESYLEINSKISADHYYNNQQEN